jgi:hypothetical protein
MQIKKLDSLTWLYKIWNLSYKKQKIFKDFFVTILEMVKVYYHKILSLSDEKWG